MAFKNMNEIKRQGFVGFKKIHDLFEDTTVLPCLRGVYLVLLPDENSPEFLEKGTGGHFKKKNPNIPVSELERNWVSNTPVVYIGKAGGFGKKATLQSRLKQYVRFGQGKSVGHYGGRYIWQLKNSKDLVVCWKVLPTEEPRVIEAALIQKFVSELGKRPFANLRD